MFNKILEKATEASKENLKNFEERQEKEKVLKEKMSEKNIIINDGHKWKINNEEPSIDYVSSKELLEIIKKHNFTILEYGKRVDEINFYEEYDPILEFYVLSYKNYEFVVRNFSDVDIPEGIFAIYQAKNIKTNEVIKYYLDLGCRNTCEIKVTNFLLLLESESKEDFINKKYEKFKILPSLLKEKGYNVTDNVEYSTDIIKGNIALDNGVYVIPYLGWQDEARLIVTNCKQWTVNDSNNYRDNRIGYYVEPNIDIIIANIEAIKKHLAGEYGFYENGIYYQNKDIERIFDVERLNPNGEYKECFNHYRIKIDFANEWDCRGYGNPYINVYNGLEMAKHFFVIFNDAHQWSRGEYINHSDIVIKYDKNIDKDNVILLLNNYQYKQNDDIAEELYEDFDDFEMYRIDELKKHMKKEFLVEHIEFRGSFTEVTNNLREFLNNMCEIFEIEKLF